MRCQQPITDEGEAAKADPHSAACGLSSIGYCVRCDLFICSLHRSSRHWRHRMRSVKYTCDQCGEPARHRIFHAFLIAEESGDTPEPVAWKLVDLCELHLYAVRFTEGDGRPEWEVAA